MKCYVTAIRIPGCRPGYQRKVRQRGEVARRAAESTGCRISCYRRRSVRQDYRPGRPRSKDTKRQRIPDSLPRDAFPTRPRDHYARHQRPQGQVFATAQDIAAGAGILVDTVNKSGTVKIHRTPKVLLLVPRR